MQTTDQSPPTRLARSRAGRLRRLPSNVTGLGVELCVGLVLGGSAAARRGRRLDDRGDVNGYVFVTIMTAGIVMVLWVVARDRLTDVFTRAITSVTGP